MNNLIAPLLMAISLAGCNAKGSSAPPPTNVAVVAGDSNASVTWDATAGVEYWVFMAPVANVTPESCSSIAGCQIITAASTPLVISAPYNGGTTGFTTYNGQIGLTNGKTFSVSINGRRDRGPGGAGSVAVSFVPRLAGNTGTWTAGTAGSVNLFGIAKGTATVSGVSGEVMVVVGAGGALYSGKDGSTWTAPVSGVPVTTDLRSASASGTLYVIAGAGGVILTSTDAASWTQRTSGSSQNLNGVTSNGAGNFVAVGDNGTILYSAGNSGTSWTTATSGTTRHLYGVGYANGLYVAVGQLGELLTSTDGLNWTRITPVTNLDLKGVAYGGQSVTGGVTSGTNTFVVVGASGALVTSTNNGANWAAQSAITGANLNAVAFGHQFVAVGDGGIVFTSTDGVSWASQTSNTVNHLYAIARGKFDYGVAGQNATTVYSK